MCIFICISISGYKRSVADNFKTSPLKKFVVDLGLWKDSVFLIWVLANGLCKFGFFIPYVHLVSTTVCFEIHLKYDVHTCVCLSPTL